jgi:hypothetical protein
MLASRNAECNWCSSRDATCGWTSRSMRIRSRSSSAPHGRASTRDLAASARSHTRTVRVANLHQNFMHNCEYKVAAHTLYSQLVELARLSLRQFSAHPVELVVRNRLCHVVHGTFVWPDVESQIQHQQPNGTRENALEHDRKSNLHKRDERHVEAGLRNAQRRKTR